jgi:hypothetical protein
VYERLVSAHPVQQVLLVWRKKRVSSASPVSSGDAPKTG